ncbi:MAG: hypothetical protein NTY71_01680 [Methanoregula sp.]|nr:hypothetical protein [Methanoregula sp.]
MRDIAAQFGTSRSSLQRHKSHIPQALTKAAEAVEVARADTLLTQIQDLRTRALALLDRAEAGTIKDNAIALREARETIKLLAQVAGELQSAPVTVNVEFRTLVLKSLESFPEARARLVSALSELRQLPEAGR